MPKAEPKTKKSTVDSLQTTENSVIKKSGSRKSVVGSQNNLTVPAFTLAGTESGTLSLPEAVFGAKVNKSLLSQAIRVYSTNQQSHHSSTKTRGEVRGSTKKIFKQKHTGNARHGARTAPIFVGGGIALGPKTRKTVLELPKKMKKAALAAALSQKMADKEILGLADLSKASGKTSQVATLLAKVGKRSVLIVDGGKNEKFALSARNIKSVSYLTTEQLNVYEIIKHKSLAITQEAVEKLQQNFAQKESK